MGSTPDTDNRLPVLLRGKPVVYSFSSESFTVLAHGAVRLNIPLRQVLWAASAPGSDILTIFVLLRKSKRLHLVERSATVGKDVSEVEAWIEDLLNLVYQGIPRRRKLKIFVNPVGGPGRAQSIYEKIVQPIFSAAKCEFDVTVTERSKHAFDEVQTLPLTYDAIVVLSGDGLVHEVINGLGQRADSATALTIPVVQIPTGSANALCINILGLKDAFDVAFACLNVIKGRPLSLDICCTTQGNRRIYSFLTQALGLMADLDLGTEHLRWMGDARFVYGFIRGVVSLKNCPVKLLLKIAEQDKTKMAEEVRAARAKIQATPHSEAIPVGELEPVGDSGNEGWTTFDKPLLYVYGGMMPYVSRDLLQFPIAKPSDGLIDLVVQEMDKRVKLASAISTGVVGGQYWTESQRYFKVHAYRVEPLGPKGFFSVDGESYPFEAFEVHVLRGLARTMSMHGDFVVNF